MNKNTPAVRIRGLAKHYPGFDLKDLDLTLEKGYIHGFIGPNGAGKTTTIKLLLGLIRRDAGDIEIFGEKLENNEKAIKEQIGFVYDNGCVYGKLRIEEMTRIAAPFYPSWDENYYRRLLGEFELDPQKKIDDLSAGMKMKYSLALALGHHPRLLIMDEPTSGLDPVSRSEILDILSRLIQDEQRTIFFSTHITTDLEKTADYISFLHRGKMLFTGEKYRIEEEYRMVKGAPSDLEAIREYLIGYRETDSSFTGLTADPKAILKAGTGYQLERPTLEEFMLHHVKGGTHVESNL